MKLKIKKVADNAIIPEYQSSGASGFDLHSIESAIVRPNETRLFSTGLAMSIPDGFEAQIRPRSGLSLKTGIRIANAPGTVDSDYRGEWKVIIENSSNKAVQIEEGDRIAQAVIQKVYKPKLMEVDSLDETERAEAGFGSTGT